MSQRQEKDKRCCPHAEGMEGDGGKDQREYLQDAITGRFYRIRHEGMALRT
jgi:hypothetical protein